MNTLLLPDLRKFRAPQHCLSAGAHFVVSASGTARRMCFACVFPDPIYTVVAKAMADQHLTTTPRTVCDHCTALSTKEVAVISINRLGGREESREALATISACIEGRQLIVNGDLQNLPPPRGALQICISKAELEKVALETLVS